MCISVKYTVLHFANFLTSSKSNLYLMKKRLLSVQPSQEMEREDLQKFFFITTDLCCVIDTEGCLRKINPAFKKLLGYGNEMVHTPFINLVHVQDADFTKQEFEAILKGRPASGITNRYLKSNGTYCWLKWTEVVLDENGLVYAVAQDITQTKEYEKRLDASANEIKTILDNITDAFFSLNREWKVVYANKKAEEVAGITKEKGLGKTFSTIFPHTKHAATAGPYRKAFNTQQPVNFEQYFEPAHMWFDVTIYPSGNLLSVYAKDITEKKKLQEKLTKEEVLRETKIANAIIEAQSNEREAIGKELHDNISQILTSTKLFLEMAEVNDAMRLELIKRSKNNALAAIAEIRSLSKKLVLPVISELNLSEAIHELINPYIITNKFTVSVNLQGNTAHLPCDVKFSVHRIVQEQLNNIAKHAQATNVTIDVSCNTWLELTVTDNGKGFDTSTQTEGIGLHNIKKRAELHSGLAQVISSPGKGCFLYVKIPLPEVAL